VSFRTFPRRFVDVLGSYGLTIVILILLLILTFLGTIEQPEIGIHDAMEKYFDSFIVWPYPLPGAVLLLGVLFVNLVVGGLLRVRRSWSRAGIFTIHIGIAVLLLGGLWERQASRKGHLVLYENESSDEFQSYFEWELRIAERLGPDRERAHVIPHELLEEASGFDGRARFRATGLPFDVVVSGFLGNARPRPATGSFRGVDGFYLEKVPRATEAERNLPGLTVEIEPDGSAVARQAILWGGQRQPWVVDAGSRRFAFELRKKSWQLPFRVLLKDTQRELYPGTQKPLAYSSDVVRVQGNVAQEVHISMNEPMRHEGYIFYQSNWGRDARGEFSGLAVVANPADRVPWIALTIITVGLVLHFTRKLWQHIRTEAGRRS